MIALLVLVFVVGYLGIVLEHNISIDKSSSALLTGALCWTVVAFTTHDPEHMNEELLHHLSEIASILFFLMGAMTIVELIDTYDGFDIITDRITTRSQTKLLWIICILTFFLSALLDNLTTTIVMVTLVKKLIEGEKLRLLFVGIIVVAANAGGAWSPMGDVTTTMLWIGGQITAVNIIKTLILPSLVCMLVPLIVLAPSIKGMLPKKLFSDDGETHHTKQEKYVIFFTGIGGLISVPIFKTVTHLPPFMGMLLALGVLWMVTELLLKDKEEHFRNNYSVYKALEKVDMPSVLFFLGILLAVSALQTEGVLRGLAGWLSDNISSQTVIVTLIGLLSSVVDNVPLVAASMGMYDLSQFPTDDRFWELLAYCAGTGGSALIIGSAAGVAAMGMEKINFFWYVKKISWLALIGYFAGIGVFLLLFP
ncbi:sodium:proton antiporter NhaD [Jiulongibacter sediminis]|jgi:Na+/H+ antiporter NhaD/arsenite permease-like protein|uniref:Sodium:proton antiporter n=1 Tax=Jiulongibacter sediminis TaxID=1605367 RepID=A0A0N8H9M3_9BACT|nr:sodium:proton antiporter NhaD [Jiulongibacter sediminis]KPM47772.1 sodium:proton antiporter [Jiulongibacter sediminis]TBX23956.1 sodium:proton antiporter [Jiulongibacter sediminis]